MQKVVYYENKGEMHVQEKTSCQVNRYRFSWIAWCCQIKSLEPFDQIFGKPKFGLSHQWCFKLSVKKVLLFFHSLLK